MNEEIIHYLLDKKIISSGNPTMTPLTGGVSSDIFLLDDGERKIVIKKALAKLRVKDNWLASTSRNKVEQDYIHYVGEILPDCMPKMIAADNKLGFFAMEYLGECYHNWKAELLQGIFKVEIAQKAAEILATIHLHSRNDSAAEAIFQTTINFYDVRIDPYLITAGDRNPDLSIFFQEEARRLKGWREALVHGDYSPKNMMISKERFVVLDQEVAWYGDPAFDLAFLLNHLYLKSLLWKNKFNECLSLCEAVIKSYFAVLGQKVEGELELRTGRLLLMLMLARIDGKSPVEYFAERKEEINFVRTFVYELLPKDNYQIGHIHKNWAVRMKDYANR
jgi:5-methylthioribose kinase